MTTPQTTFVRKIVAVDGPLTGIFVPLNGADVVSVTISSLTVSQGGIMANVTDYGFRAMAKLRTPTAPGLPQTDFPFVIPNAIFTTMGNTPFGDTFQQLSRFIEFGILITALNAAVPLYVTINVG